MCQRSVAVVQPEVGAVWVEAGPHRYEEEVVWSCPSQQGRYLALLPAPAPSGLLPACLGPGHTLLSWDDLEACGGKICSPASLFLRMRLCSLRDTLGARGSTSNLARGVGLREEGGDEKVPPDLMVIPFHQLFPSPCPGPRSQTSQGQILALPSPIAGCLLTSGLTSLCPRSSPVQWNQ